MRRLVTYALLLGWGIGFGFAASAIADAIGKPVIAYTGQSIGGAIVAGCLGVLFILAFLPLKLFLNVFDPRFFTRR